MEISPHLPLVSSVSPSLLRFLADSYHTVDSLTRTPDLVSVLQNQCSDLEQALSDLNLKLWENIDSCNFHSQRVGTFFGEITEKLGTLRSSASVGTVFQDWRRVGGPEIRAEQILANELPSFAKEVARVETVHAYADTALKLDTLIGDVEDAVSSSMTGNPRRVSSAFYSDESQVSAIKYLKQVEDILASLTKSRPQWRCLISAVDYRVDRALAILRPQAIADHRNLLSSLGWPPPLSASVDSTTKKSSGTLNPLFMMHGDLKNKYCLNFLALCSLQQLQRRRKMRQLEGHNLEVALHQPLWAIEELVNPISLALHRHFIKWFEKPEFIFALVYKVTREFVDSMDDVLQPLMDKARLSGYSCREEWISAMVTSLSTYLAKEIIPKYVNPMGDAINSDPYRARTPWLHLVDLMIAFDKRIQSLITNSGALLSLREEESLQRISSLSVFCDRPDWLEVWAEVELMDAMDKLKPLLEDEKNWRNRIKDGILLLGTEDYKSPEISASLLHCLSSLVERCRPLPSSYLRARFIRLTVASVLHEFIGCLHRRCQDAEGLTALADDEALVKVVKSINAACYCESILEEWCEDVFFIEMESDNAMEGEENGMLKEEIEKLKDFRREWLEKISIVVLRGFDALCRDYFKNKKQWQNKREGGSLSRAFISALDYLQGKISTLEQELNKIDFIGAWRSIASGVDQLVLNGVLISNSKFHDGGIETFRGDMEILFGLFSAWCLRPEGFFPRVHEGLRLLQMEKEKAKGPGSEMESWLRENGIRHLTVAEAEKILKNRIS